MSQIKKPQDEMICGFFCSTLLKPIVSESNTFVNQNQPL